MGRNLASSLSQIKSPTLLQQLASDVAALEKRIATLELRIYEQPHTDTNTDNVPKQKPRRSPKASKEAQSTST